MGINWDGFLESPDDQEPEIKVSNCAACGDDLLAGDEVAKSRTLDLYFCNMGCAGQYARLHQEELGLGADVECLDIQIVTLEELEPDYDDKEDDEP